MNRSDKCCRVAKAAAPVVEEPERRTPVPQRTTWDYGEASQYEKRQGSKLTKKFKKIVGYDKNIFIELHKRFAKWKDEEGNMGYEAFVGKNVLCVGARLGAEVKAFKKLGAVAVGIDFNPGERNPHVMFGNALDIMFPSSAFDFLYINVMDHISDWPAFLEETKRVLKPHGIFFNDLDQNKMDDFAVHDNVKERKKLEQLVATKGFEEVSRRVINDEKDPGKYFYVNRSDKGP